MVIAGVRFQQGVVGRLPLFLKGSYFGLENVPNEFLGAQTDITPLPPKCLRWGDSLILGAIPAPVGYRRPPCAVCPSPRGTRAMQRDFHLQGLTSEHHQALVLAGRLRQACRQGGVSRERLQSTCRTFEQDLNPHFVIEEELILPALAAAGRKDLVDRTNEEHRKLRSLIAAAERAEDATNATMHLHAFADLLTAHVRFEERTLFDAAQQILTPEELERLATIRPHSRPTARGWSPAQESSEPGLQTPRVLGGGK